MLETIPKPVSGADMALENVGTRYVRGGNLTIADENMAMVASAAKSAERFGPSVADFKVNRPQLPESVKGTLVEYAS